MGRRKNGDTTEGGKDCMREEVREDRREGGWVGGEGGIDV